MPEYNFTRPPHFLSGLVSSWLARGELGCVPRQSASGVPVDVIAKDVAEALASRVVSDATDGDILWATLPTLHEAANEYLPLHAGLEYPRDVILRSALVGPRLVLIGHVVGMMNTVNEALALRPVLDEVARRRGGQPKLLRAAALQSSDVVESWRRCTRLEHDLRAEAKSIGITLDPGSLRRRLLKAARASTLLRAAHQRGDFQTLLVSNQHLSDHRAALHFSTKHRVSSLYVPHAPVASNDLYHDLPVNAAALRGDLEVDYYRSLGALRDRLHSVGNPSVPPLNPPSRLDGPIVLALSPWSHDRMREVISLVRDGIGTQANIVVAPHPRNRRREVRRLLPDGWSLNSDRTLDLLARGPRLLIQHSSGIAWEGLYLGIPTIQVQVDDEAPNYPLISEPFVRTVRTGQELHETMMTASKEVDRVDLRDWAHRWCAEVGVVAAKRIVDVIEDMPEDPELVLDAWSRP